MSLRKISLMFMAAGLMAGCAEEQPAATAAPTEEPTEVKETVPAPVAPDALLAKAEGMIDAFYSFDRERLAPFLAKAGEAKDKILYYQGWAEGGNYKVLKRAPCVAEAENVIRCSITVEDDPVLALGLDFKVTDSFAITFDGEDIVGVETSSDDKPIYGAARKWVEANMPEVMAGPCSERGTGAGTPGDCARAMTEGYRQYAASDDFLGLDWEG